MNRRLTSRIYRATADVYWVVEECGTLVVDEKTSHVFRLAGLEQLVWDCLALGYPADQLLQMVAYAGKLSLQVAKQETKAILHEWLALGLLVVEEGCAHG